MATSAPKTNIPALIVLTSEYDAKKFCFFFFVILTIFLFLLNFISEPRDFKRFIIVSMSLTRGKFFIMTSFSNKIVDAKIGKAAFFEPEIEISPFILQGPLTINLSIIIFLEV